MKACQGFVVLDGLLAFFLLSLALSPMLIQQAQVVRDLQRSQLRMQALLQALSTTAQLRRMSPGSSLSMLANSATQRFLHDCSPACSVASVTILPYPRLDGGLSAAAYQVSLNWQLPEGQHFHLLALRP